VSHHISLESFDKDGAVREAAEAAGANRRDFLRKGAIAGGGFVAGGVLFNGLMSPAQAAISTRNKSKRNDVKILNYALTLEYLESAFYTAALNNKVSGGDAALVKFTEVVEAHEASHVKGLKAALGSAAIKKPTFDFGNAVTDLATYRATAQVLEDTGVSAYAGQGPNVFQKPVVQVALSIHSVEARHAAWIRYLNGVTPAPATYDKAASEKTVLKAVTATGFIQ
jgi:hypothetical protein